jgi:hypothetical protein
MPPAPASKTAQNASRAHPGATQAKPPAALPEAKQAKLDSVLAMLDELKRQEVKTVIAGEK